MSRPARILVTGARLWTDRIAVTRALTAALGTYAGIGLPVLIHGGAIGADSIADDVWRSWSGGDELALRRGAGRLLAEPEVHPARDHASPRARNQHMVDLGATVCLAFALKWESGTGMCARMARSAGIHTIDLGVSTASRRSR